MQNFLGTAMGNFALRAVVRHAVAQVFATWQEAQRSFQLKGQGIKVSTFLIGWLCAGNRHPAVALSQ